MAVTGLAVAGLVVLFAWAGLRAQGPADVSAEAERRAVEELTRLGLPVPPPEERRRLIESVRPNLGRATLNTTPVPLEIAGVRLVIPSNYLADIGRDAAGAITDVVLHVVFPGMEGATPGTAACISRGPACEGYTRLYIYVPGPVSARQGLANLTRPSPDLVWERLPGPNGLEIIRQAVQRVEGSDYVGYRTVNVIDDQDVIAWCFVLADRSVGGCETRKNTINGVAFSFMFRGIHIEHLAEMDQRYRNLVRNFIRQAQQQGNGDK